MNVIITDNFVSQNMNNENILLQLISYYISKGEVVIIPTDTIYGFSCIAYNRKSVQRVAQIKQRSLSKNFIVFVDRYLLNLVSGNTVPDIILQQLPNPVTLIVKNHIKHLIDSDTISVRYPNNSFILKLIDIVGAPIISTSANISEQNYIHDFKHISQLFCDKVSCIIKGKDDKNDPLPSTIIDVVNNFKVIRQGSYKLKL